MLFKLSVKNIRKSLKDYTIYFLTLLFSVAVFYVFNSLEDQQAMIQLTNAERSTITQMWTQIMNVVSIATSVVLGILIVYANMFLIKKRKKEFGVYMTLGMSKIKITAVIVLETIFVAVISLAAGLLLGVFGSQPMTVLVAKMFEANMDKFAFVFSKGAFLKTCIYFSIMYIAVIVFSTIAVSRYKLITLFQSAKKNETIRIKNPILCTAIFVIAVAILSYAYWRVTGYFKNIKTETDIIIPVVLGVIATFLIFWSLSGLILRLAKRNKKFYLKGTNMFVLKQIDSKINTTVIGMTIICLLLFVTICMLSMSIALRNAMTSEINKTAPADLNVMLSYNSLAYDEETDTEYRVEAPEQFKTLVLSEALSERGLKKEMLKETVNIAVYLGNNEDVSYLPDYANFFSIVKLSDYNKLAEIYGFDKLNLGEDEYVFVCDVQASRTTLSEHLKNGEEIEIKSKKYTPGYSECQNGFLYISEKSSNYGMIIVPDSCPLTESKAETHFMAAKYNTENRIEKEKTDEEFKKAFLELMNDFEMGYEYLSYHNDTYFANYNLRSDILNDNIGPSTIIVFVSLYLSIVFMITSAAVLSLKQLTDSTDNKERYAVLRKIGCDEKMINKALFQQIAIFFTMPLLLAVIHSIFGIRFASLLLSLSRYTFSNMIWSIVTTGIILMIVYGAYFLATYFGSKNIIKEEK